MVKKLSLIFIFAAGSNVVACFLPARRFSSRRMVPWQRPPGRTAATETIPTDSASSNDRDDHDAADDDSCTRKHMRLQLL